MTKFERLLEAKNEAERLGAILIKKYPEKRNEIYEVVIKHVNNFENYCYQGDKKC